MAYGRKVKAAMAVGTEPNIRARALIHTHAHTHTRTQSFTHLRFASKAFEVSTIWRFAL